MATKAASGSPTLDLGDMTGSLERHLATGLYDSIDELMQAALRALDREQNAVDNDHRKLIDEALADPRPAVPINEAFARIDKWKAARGKA